MKYLLTILLLGNVILPNCTLHHGITNIEPKKGTIEIPAKSEFRMWKNIKHGGFTVMLTNASSTQSVELYKVKSDGREKWISPSLIARSSKEVEIPADGYLLIKNFNSNKFIITYKIAE